ncbi:flagellin [Halopseudomonas sp. SMJS2]|uniref:flagellin n=1 Tax=Halopseudomonas sp. SMJS2 TaxID=3041098 RepID=UPI002453336D|nr:flagellin [Halopseudomonas sp. SMJS2]WGK60651.1 flagellin [Halopseudomonas sp. SMJS2]
MALTVNSNIASLNAQRNLSGSTNALSTSLERLSSGSRINSAKDDAAGLQISNRLTSQINGLNVAVKNANDGMSMAQTAEGALQESTNIMQRMRDLALQASNGSNSAEERKALNQEFSNLSGELTRIAETTTFGGKSLLNGTLTGESFQVGSNAGETLSFSIGDMSAKGLTGTSTLASATGGLATGFNEQGELSAATSIKLNGTLVNFEEGDTVDKVVDKINNASTGVTATKAEIAADPDATPATEAGVGINLSSLEDFSVDGLGVEALGLERAGTEARTEYTATGTTFTAPGAASTFTITVDGEDTTIDVLDSDTVQTLMDRINEDTATTGVTASLNTDEDALVLTSDAAFTLGGTATDAGLTVGAATDNEIAAVSKVEAEPETHTLDSLDVLNVENAQVAIQALDDAIASVDSTRADLGAVQNRFESTISNLQNISENASNARGRIMDTDYAAESANLAKNQIMQQAGTAMLAQANQLPQAVLSLLG